MTDKDTPHFSHKLYLIRHGETKWSKSRQHTGLTDIPLTKEGEEEALRVPHGLKEVKFAKVFVSPLQRALKTCELAGFKDEAIVTDDLLEWDYGDYEGVTTADIRKKEPNWNLFKDGVPNGETIQEVSDRVDHILNIASQVDGDVAFFSSGHVSRIIGARWINLPPTNGQVLALSTASISILGYEHEWRVIHTWNSTSHLK